MNSMKDRKISKRNSSSSPFNINIDSDFDVISNINYSNSNLQLLNPNYENQSIYLGNKINDHINNINLCPDCLSYQQKIKEKNLIIQKLQNQISRLNSSISTNSSNILSNMNLNDINNKINNYKKIILDLKNEISEKNGQISQIQLTYDEQIFYLDAKNKQLEEEVSKLNRENIFLNKTNLKLNEMKILNNDEINKYKEKVQALLNTIESKNNDIRKLKEVSNKEMDDLENKYMNLSSNYNTLAFSSGVNKLIKYSHQKTKTNNDSDFSNEEDKIAEILINSGKLAKKKSSNSIDLINSKSQKLYYDSGSENKIIRINRKLKIKNESIGTPKMSSTQSSWMISKKPHELQILQKDFQNMKKKLEISIQENQKLKKNFGRK